ADDRIRTLEEQASMAGEARLFAEDRRLFDEEERAVRASRVLQRPGAQSSEARGTGGGSAETPTEAADPNAANGRGNEAPASPAPGTDGFLGNGASDDVDAVGGGGNAPPPAQSVGSTATGGV